MLDLKALLMKILTSIKELIRKTPFSVDSSNNVTFPAKITATSAQINGALATTGTISTNGTSVTLSAKNTANGSVNSNCTSGSILCFKRGNCVIIRLQNLVVKKLTARTTVATIPAGYRPPAEVYGYINGDANLYWMVETNGEVKVEPTESKGLYSCITYPVWD